MIDEKSAHEGEIGRSLEDSGRLPKLWRDPSGAAEFIDQTNQAWDIKGFKSDIPEGFSVADAIRLIGDSIGENEKVILDTTSISGTDLETLSSAVEQERGWESYVIWWP